MTTSLLHQNSLRSLVVFYFLSIGQILSIEFCTYLRESNLEQVCEDHIPSHVCITVFGPNKLGKKRPKLCESPYLQTEALQCAKHCRICCERREHACRDSRIADSARGSCKRHRIDQSCWRNGDMSSKMVRDCDGTCGLCNRQKRAWEEELMCRDSQWDCPDMRDFCAFDERVQRICPKTCQEELKRLRENGKDPCEKQKDLYEFQWSKPPEDEDCWDTRPDCRNEMFFCDMPNYFDKLKEECPRTCAHCKPPGHKCADKNIKKCADWQGHKHRPFCQSHSFSKGVKFHWCPKTCEMC